MVRLLARYFANLLILPLVLLDTGANTLMGGSPFETISERMGRVKMAHGGEIPRRRFILRFMDRVCELVDDNHSIEAATTPAGRAGVLDRF